MPDVEISPPSQHAAALQTNPRYSEAEEDHREAEHLEDDRPGRAGVGAADAAGRESIGASVTDLAASIDQVGVLQPAQSPQDPAVVFTVSLYPDARQGAEDDAQAFAGDPVDMVLRCAREAAEQHGGPLTVTTTSRSLVIEFAAPQPEISRG